MRPANERRYIVTPSISGWVHSQNDPCINLVTTGSGVAPVQCQAIAWTADDDFLSTWPIWINHTPKIKGRLLTTLSSLVAPQFDFMTTYGVTSDDKVVKLTTVCFQWMCLWKGLFLIQIIKACYTYGTKPSAKPIPINLSSMKYHRTVPWRFAKALVIIYLISLPSQSR